MKLKYIFGLLVLTAMGGIIGWDASQYGRTGSAIAAVLLIVSALLLVFGLFKKKSDAPKKHSKLLTLVIVMALVSTAAMPFVNGLVSFRPKFTYKNYYCSGRFNQKCFPEQIPEQATAVRFQVLGEGIASHPFFMLSFETDPAFMQSLRQAAETNAHPVPSGSSITIPSDLTPKLPDEPMTEYYDIFEFQDQYGEKSHAFFHKEQPLVFYFEGDTM